MDVVAVVAVEGGLDLRVRVDGVGYGRRLWRCREGCVRGWLVMLVWLVIQPRTSVVGVVVVRSRRMVWWWMVVE